MSVSCRAAMGAETVTVAMGMEVETAAQEDRNRESSHRVTEKLPSLTRDPQRPT